MASRFTGAAGRLAWGPAQDARKETQRSKEKKAQRDFIIHELPDEYRLYFSAVVRA